MWSLGKKDKDAPQQNVRLIQPGSIETGGMALEKIVRDEVGMGIDF